MRDLAAWQVQQQHLAAASAVFTAIVDVVDRAHRGELDPVRAVLETYLHSAEWERRLEDLLRAA